MKTIVNRYRQRLTVGQRVRYHLPRGGTEEGTITGFETTGEFVRAYGTRVRLGARTVAADDCTPISRTP